MIVKYQEDTGKITGTAVGTLSPSDFNEPVIQVPNDTELDGKKVDTSSRTLAYDYSLSEAQSKCVEDINEDAKKVLSETDWYITRRQETGEAIPQDVLDHRSAVRAQSDSFEQEVKNLADIEDVLNYSYEFSSPPNSDAQ